MFSTILAVVASQVVGALWYSPLMVGKAWACIAYPGLSLQEIKNLLSPGTNYVIAFISSMCTTLLLKYYLLQSVSTVTGALSVSLVLGGFSACLEISHYGFEGRPWKLFVIDHFHNFFNILVISCVLVLL